MPHYLYVADDLASAGSLDTDALAATTERHKVRLETPALAPMANLADAVHANGIDGVIFRLGSGVLPRPHLRAAARVLSTHKRLWLHWPSEGAVECIDAERLRSLWRHWACVGALRGIDPILWRLGAVRRMPAAARWAYRGSFPVDRAGILDRLAGLYESAKAVPLPESGWRSAGISGAGLYLRGDYWNAMTSGGSYGHTCYVAKELRDSSSGGVVCLLPHRYTLLDQLGVRQEVMDSPERIGGEEAIVKATPHYYGIVKAACQVLRPAYIYERLVLGNYAAAMVSRDLRIPYIVEYNGSEISIQRSFQGANPFLFPDIFQAAEAFAFRQATLISVVSQIVKDDLVARGVEAARILVNPNGADLDSYAPAGDDEKQAIRRDLGFEPDDRVVGFTATFGGWHGVDVLAAALPRICEAAPAIRFLLIGDGTYKAQVDEVIARHGLTARVRSAGRVPQAEGARLLKACDVYVAPHNAHMVDSRFFGSPTKIFEYMAMGGGIVASDLEQIGQVLSPALRVGDLRNGAACAETERAVLVTPGDVDEFVEAVVHLANNPALCRRLGRNSRQAVIDHFSWKRHVEKLWRFARDAQRTAPTAIATGEAYKDEVQNQWNNSPVGSERARTTQPHSLEWFREIEADRYGAYAPWMPAVMEFAGHAGDDVLEIGGGLGIDLAQFASHGARVTDVDLSAGHLALAEEHFRLRGLHGRFVHHDGEQLPFSDASFDLVYSNGVIHHTPNTSRMVDEIFRVLRPGGRVIVMVYAENSINYWRNVVFWRGMKEGQLGHSSMGEILSKSVELSGTDARPLVKVYTRARLRRLFRRFADIHIAQRQLRPDEVPRPLRPVRALLERTAGWNLIVKARKPR